MSQPISMSSPSMKRIRKVLAEITEPISLAELADKAYISRNTMKCAYRGFLVDAGEMHVSAWVRNLKTGGGHTPLFSIGPGEPAKQPKKMTPAQKCKEWRKREGYNERYNAERKSRRRIAMPVDPVLAALIGVRTNAQAF